MKEDMEKVNKDKKKNPHEDHRKRMRERFSKTGFDGMHPHQILEMLLFYSIPRKDTNIIAHNLIDRFKTVAGVFEATEEQLKQVEGIGDTSAALIRMMLPLFHEYTKSTAVSTKLITYKMCGEYIMSQYAGIIKERVCIACLDSSNRVIAFDTVCEGDVSSVVVDNRTLLSIVLKYPKTASVVLAHNHPGGVAMPSREDIKNTDAIADMLNGINIKLLDHIIVCPDDYVSMASSIKFMGCFTRYGKT